MQTKVPKIIEGNFYKIINKAIGKDLHVDYLKEYETYKKVFAKALTDKNPHDKVYLFRITYHHRKPIWRDIVIRGNQTFEDLAEAIVDSMGWDNDHMHGFSLPEKQKGGYFYYAPFTLFADGWEDDAYPTYKSNQIMICNIDYDLYPKLKFEFDFGDSHIFEIHLKEIRDSQNGESLKNLPKVVDQRGIAPEQYQPLEDGLNDNFFEDSADDLKGKFIPFMARFPKIAMEQAKTLEIVFDGTNVPEEYLLLENYCLDKK